MDIAGELRKGLGLHRDGRLAEAGDIYARVLEAEPDNADALNLMGVVLQAAGDCVGAIGLLRRATELAPEYFAAHVNLGNAQQGAGRLEDAVCALQTAIRLNPDAPEALNNLASVLNGLGRHQEAEDACARALALAPRFAEALNNLGNALIGLGRAEEAAQNFQASLAIDANSAEAHFNLGNALMDLGATREAAASYGRAVDLDGDDTHKLYNLGNALRALDRAEDAVDCYRRALEADPDNTDALNNLAAACKDLGKLDEARECYRRALSFEPDSADLHWNHSLVLLQSGEFAEGWREYEWRWRTPSFAHILRDFEPPRWEGGDLSGKTILVHAEQGFGDAIQFVRYAPMVAARGGRVVLECRPGLERLFAGVEGVAEVVTLGAPLPPFDVHIPLMSLPRVFATELDTIPDAVPYLSLPAGAEAGDEITAAPGLKVGIVWAGSPTRPDNDKRSCEPGHFAPLMGIPGTTFFSLQVGEFAAGLRELEGEAVDLAPGLGDFADTAAAVQALDLVISVDTAVLHLAGALARPAWGALSFATGFLWMQGRDDSPWYPTMRLFRQETPGDWEPVFRRLGRELEALAGA
ncbi:MAG: tetratricopeptide repeat protein [Proteobacteria bacterium]|nr:tetratricopeptide repeat protein [Pseudomonadota bacterium]